MSIMGLLGSDDDQDEADKLLHGYMRYHMAERAMDDVSGHLFGDQDLDRQDRALDIELKRKELGLPLDEDLLESDIEPDDSANLRQGLRTSVSHHIDDYLGDRSRSIADLFQPLGHSVSGAKTGLVPHLKNAYAIGENDAGTIGRLFRR